MGSEGQCCHHHHHSPIFVGAAAPEFSGQAYFRDWEGGFKDLSLADYQWQWLLLFFYPLDFTSVCNTEITAFSDRVADFTSRNCAVLGASVDSQYAHKAWVERGDLGDLRYPLLADFTKRVSRDYGVLSREKGYAYRGSFLISPEGILRYSVVHEVAIGRNVEETLRVLDALQTGGFCAANWHKGDKNL